MGDLTDRGEEPPLERALETRAGEVLALGEEVDPAVDHQREEEAVHHREVIARQDGGPVDRDVLVPPLDRRATQDAEERSQEDVLERPVPHETLLAAHYS